MYQLNTGIFYNGEILAVEFKRGHKDNFDHLRCLTAANNDNIAELHQMLTDSFRI